MPVTDSSTTWDSSESRSWTSNEYPTTRLANRADVKSRAGTMSAATPPRTGSMITSTTATTMNIVRLARVIGSMARIKRSWLRSDEALAMSSPVEFTSWNENAMRWMWVKSRFRMSASARYESLNPK